MNLPNAHNKLRERFFGMIRIRILIYDPRIMTNQRNQWIHCGRIGFFDAPRSKWSCIIDPDRCSKRTGESTLGKDSSVSLMRHDLSDVRSLILIQTNERMYLKWQSKGHFSLLVTWRVHVVYCCNAPFNLGYQFIQHLTVKDLRLKDSRPQRSLQGSLIYLYVLQDPFDSQSSFCDPATRLCLCEVDKSVVTVVLPSDRSVQIHCMLNGCVVEDVRKGTVSAFPR